jgi:hypothetical protein
MFRKTFVVTALLLGTAGAASAQRWDAPLFHAPYAMDELGLYYVRSDRESDFGDFGDANGLKLIWRQSGNLNLGVHVGTGDLENIGESILVGAELYGPLAFGATSGLMMNWTAGVGAAFGDLGDDAEYIDFSVPLGVSVGLRLGSGNTVFTPFIHPRASLDVVAVTINDVEESETEFKFAADVGAELNLGARFLVRGAATFGGDREAFGIGLALRTPRPISGPARR